MVGVSVASFGMASVFAFPAYATPEVEEFQYYTPVQQLTTADADGSLGLQGPKAELAPTPEPEPATQTASATAAAGFSGADLPAGSGASGLVAAALAQQGQAQDCTAMVERALRAIGYSVGNVGVTGFDGYGKVVRSGAYAPGDIMVWPGHPHVAIYIGNGMAVHGGYNGSTVVAGYKSYGQVPAYVVRVG